MRFRYVWISVGAIMVVVFLFSADPLARIAWQKYRAPEIAITLDRTDAALAMQIGNYYFNGGAYDLEIAAHAYERANAIDPRVLWGHYQRARILFIKGDFSGAIEEINRELLANPSNLRSLYVRGLIYGYHGDLDKAEDDFRSFTQWAPKEWAGYNDLAWILEKRGKYKAAKDAIAKAFVEIPQANNNPWLWNSLGVAELNLGNHADAHNAFKRAQTLANSLTEADFRKSYPGNAPAEAGSGLKVFRDAIMENLTTSGSVDK